MCNNRSLAFNGLPIWAYEGEGLYDFDNIWNKHLGKKLLPEKKLFRQKAFVKKQKSFRSKVNFLICCPRQSWFGKCQFWFCAPWLAMCLFICFCAQWKRCEKFVKDKASPSPRTKQKFHFFHRAKKRRKVLVSKKVGVKFPNSNMRRPLFAGRHTWLVWHITSCKPFLDCKRQKSSLQRHSTNPTHKQAPVDRVTVKCCGTEWQQICDFQKRTSRVSACVYSFGYKLQLNKFLVHQKPNPSRINWLNYCLIICLTLFVDVKEWHTCSSKSYDICYLEIAFLWTVLAAMEHR